MHERLKYLREKLIEVGAVKYGDFVLSSGKKSNIYIDIKLACTYPEILDLIAELMKDSVGDVEKISCIELGAVPLAVAVSLKTGLPLSIFRKRRKDYGTGDDLIGEIKPGEKICVIEDVTTTGNSVISVIERVAERGGEVKEVIVVVDREEGAEKRIKSLNVEFKPLLIKSQLMR